MKIMVERFRPCLIGAASSRSGSVNADCLLVLVLRLSGFSGPPQPSPLYNLLGIQYLSAKMTVDPGLRTLHEVQGRSGLLYFASRFKAL